MGFSLLYTFKEFFLHQLYTDTLRVCVRVRSETNVGEKKLESSSC